MRSQLAKAIRNARIDLRLTQAELAMRLGVKTKAVSRWEVGDSAPTPRHRRALVTAVQAVNGGVATQLAAAIAASSAKRGAALVVAPVAPPAEPSAPPQAVPISALELAIYRAADDVDLAPRRLREALAKLIQTVQHAGYTLDTLHQELESTAGAAEQR